MGSEGEGFCELLVEGVCPGVVFSFAVSVVQHSVPIPQQELHRAVL